MAFLWSKIFGAKGLGSLGEPPYSSPNDINESGQIVGSSWDPGRDLLRAFLWSEKGGMLNLGTSGHPSMPYENAFSLSFGINNRGEIVGDSDNFAFLWTARGGMLLLDSLLGEPPLGFSAAWDINDRGWIVGISHHTLPDIYHAALWTKSEILDLGTIKLHSHALGINNFGEIVGGSGDVFSAPHARFGDGFEPSCVAFLWTARSGISQLPTLGGTAGCAHAINDEGQVVGWSFTAENEGHAFLWTSKGGIMDLGTLPGASVQESAAYGINQRGQVVGYSVAEDGTRHAVIWTVK